MTELQSITPIVEGVENLFSILNDLCYEGSLEKPIIIIAPNTRKSACLSKSESTEERVWKDTNTKSTNAGSYELKLSSHVLNETKEEICAILLHEMAHLYCAMNGKRDTNKNGSYHNRVYYEIASGHGLKIEEKDKKYGWCNTVLALDIKEALTKKLEEHGDALENRFEMYRPDLPKPPQKATVRKSNSRKYVCQYVGCKEIVRGTKDSNIKCGIHNCKMVLEDNPEAHSLTEKTATDDDILSQIPQIPQIESVA